MGPKADDPKNGLDELASELLTRPRWSTGTQTGEQFGQAPRIAEQLRAHESTMHSLDVTCLEARVLQPDKVDVSASGHESRSNR